MFKLRLGKFSAFNFRIEFKLYEKLQSTCVILKKLEVFN